MLVRDLAQLEQDQARLLASYKLQRRQTQVARPAEHPGSGGAIGIGRVLEIVQASPVHGPHLVVIMQTFTGRPPKPRDAAASACICHPPPGRSPADYRVGDFVHILRAGGAALAVGLG